jgi:hypothetical protein
MGEGGEVANPAYLESQKRAYLRSLLTLRHRYSLLPARHVINFTVMGKIWEIALNAEEGQGHTQRPRNARVNTTTVGIILKRSVITAKALNTPVQNLSPGQYMQGINSSLNFMDL